jgi:hypothetical protein
MTSKNVIEVSSKEEGTRSKKSVSKAGSIKLKKGAKTNEDNEVDLDQTEENKKYEETGMSKIFKELDKVENQREEEAIVEEEEIGYREDLIMDENENKSQKTDNES